MKLKTKLKRKNVTIIVTMMIIILFGSMTVQGALDAPTIEVDYPRFLTPDETKISIELSITFHGVRTRIRGDIYLYYSVNKLSGIENEGCKIIDPEVQHSFEVMIFLYYLTNADLTTIKDSALGNGDTIRFKILFEWGTILSNEGNVDSGIKIVKYRTGGYTPENAWWISRNFNIAVGVIGGVIALGLLCMLRRRIRR